MHTKARPLALEFFQESLAKPWYLEILKKLQGKRPFFRVHLVVLGPLSERATSPRRLAARESMKPSKPPPCSNFFRALTLGREGKLLYDYADSGSPI